MANTNKGRKVFICETPQPNDLDAAAFAGLTWVQIGHVGMVGESGTSENIVNYDELETDVIQKSKGLANAGDPQIEVARTPTDAGQVILKAAGATPDDYAMKFEDLGLPGFTGSIYYNRGKITGPTRPNGRAEDFNVEVYTLAGNQREVVVAPAALAVPAGANQPTGIPAIGGLADASSGLLTITYVGQWTNSPTSYLYKWQKDNGGDNNFVDISGATGLTYDPVGGDVGDAIRAAVRAVNSAGQSAGYLFSFPSPLVVA